MANKSLFRSAATSAPATSGRNHAGAPAYTLGSRTALAQLAATGCFGNTYYVTGGEQLAQVLHHASACEPAFVAKVAVYARRHGHMKDMPAVLLAHLATRGPEGLAAMRASFSQVVDNGRMLRNFVQVLRSGQLGRKSLGTAPKKAVQRWLQGRTSMQLFRDSVGNDPSLVDVIKMVHPKPKDAAQRAMFGYLLGRPHDVQLLPLAVRSFEAWKHGEGQGELPKVPSRMLQGLPLRKEDWLALARAARWQETRMNLNAYRRHGVFEDAHMVKRIAERLADPQAIRKARVFPYQLLATWRAATGVPAVIREALSTAMEHAVANAPLIEGRVVLCPDVSGSMMGPVTGHRRGATSSVRCVEAAGLITASVLRRNPESRVLPFDYNVRELALNPRDSVTTLASQLASVCGGGTNCSAPLAWLNAQKMPVDTVVYISDCESWVDARAGRGTAMMEEWRKLKKRRPEAKLVCIDLTPNVHKQVVERSDILHVGGFSDSVFDVLARFASEREAHPWAELIEQQSLT